MEHTYYLNNTGSRWVTFDAFGRRQQITLTTVSGREVKRRVVYWEQLGNYAVAVIKYHGKRIRVFTTTLLED